MVSNAPAFNAERFKSSTRDQWNKYGSGYNTWGHVIDGLIHQGGSRMMDLAGLSVGDFVLELAAGSGVMTLKAAERVGPQGSVLATDLSPGILAFSEQNAKAKGFDNVKTQVIDGEAVDLEEDSFDAVMSSLGLMFFPDPLRSLTAQRRVVRPGKTVAALVISTPDKNPFFAIPAKVIRERANLPPPAPGLPGPFALGAPGLIEGMFEKAGLGNVVREVFSGTLALPSVADHLRFLSDAFAALHQMMIQLSEEEKSAVWEEAGQALGGFQTAEGFRCPYELIVCVGTK